MARAELFDAGPLHVYAFPPAWLRLVVAPIGDGQATPMRAADALVRSGAKAVLDGPMFDLCPGQPGGATQAERYAAARCASLDYLHLDRAAGVLVPSNNPGTGVTAIVQNGRVTWVRGGRAGNVPAGASVAVQLNPLLVWNGGSLSQSTGASNLDRVQRAALAELEDGRLAFVTGNNTLQGFADSLENLRVKFGGYTDGGGSTRLLTADGNWFGASEDRPVASWLAAVEPPDWRVIGAGLAAAGSLLAWWYARSGRQRK